MIRSPSFFSFVLVLFCTACVDRINFNVGFPEVFPLVVDGFISTESGPYLVKVSGAYDIESKSTFRIPISVKSMTIRDDQGLQENLQEGIKGFYYTNHLQGQVGHVYTLHIEMLDGRIYESLPDTLYPGGTVDKVYYQFRTQTAQSGVTESTFDVFFDSSAGSRHYNYLWKFTGTYQADISCCQCYVDLVNPYPMVSNDQFIADGKFIGIKAMTVPVNPWIFMHKIHAQVSQRSLSRRAFDFWKAVAAQLKGVNSLFQPITGKIAGNFVQLAGEDSPLQGIFYATDVASNSVFIYRNDVPNENLIPKLELSPATANYDPANNTCPGLFPNSTTKKPTYWGD